MLRVRFVFAGIAAMLLLGIFLLPRVQATGGTGRPANDSAQRTPVLVELFTSEGCSDCPPADALLERLDRSQPVSGAELIVLSEHVDYWNDIGWKDPFSSHEYSERQGSYAGQFGLGSVYTPQMVVDGRIQLVGSDERGAIEAIENATKAEKIPVSLSSAHCDWPVAFLNLREVRERLARDSRRERSIEREPRRERREDTPARRGAARPCPSWSLGSVRQIFSGCRYQFQSR